MQSYCPDMPSITKNASGPHQHSPKKRHLRHQVINLTPPKRFRAWGYGPLRLEELFSIGYMMWMLGHPAPVPSSLDWLPYPETIHLTRSEPLAPQQAKMYPIYWIGTVRQNSSCQIRIRWNLPTPKLFWVQFKLLWMSSFFLGIQWSNPLLFSFLDMILKISHIISHNPRIWFLQMKKLSLNNHKSSELFILYNLH